MRRGFTLIELLVVVAVVGVLSVVVVLAINPAELLKQSRDSKRFSDLNTLTTALGVFSVDQPASSLGNSKTVYVSVPDSTTTCANLGLPAAPSGWSYYCATTANLQKVNGTGWIPVDLTSGTFGSPISTLPIDTTNSTSSALFFSYSPSSTNFEVAGVIESNKYLSKAAGDGGLDGGLYETGTKFSIIPFIHGLVAYWSFDDGNEANVADLSGYGNTATWNGTSTTHYATGHNGPYAAYFGGNSDYLSTALTSGPSAGRFGTGDFTVMFWAKGNGVTGAYPNYIHGAQHCGCSHYSWEFTAAGSVNLRSTAVGGGSTASFDMSGNVWRFIAGGRSGGQFFLYVDGALIGTAADTSTLDQGDKIYMGTARLNGGPYLDEAFMDEVRIYSRALTATEISNIYNATR